MATHLRYESSAPRDSVWTSARWRPYRVGCFNRRYRATVRWRYRRWWRWASTCYESPFVLLQAGAFARCEDFGPPMLVAALLLCGAANRGRSRPSSRAVRSACYSGGRMVKTFSILLVSTGLVAAQPVGAGLKVGGLLNDVLSVRSVPT